MTSPRGAYAAWQADVCSAFGWNGAAVGSLGTTGLYALTTWWMAALCGVVYLVGGVMTYRRAFLAPLVGNADSGGV